MRESIMLDLYFVHSQAGLTPPAGLPPLRTVQKFSLWECGNNNITTLKSGNNFSFVVHDDTKYK